ncbi:MAG: homogentisate 1,2-dioxygenase [Sphingomonadaceae bacterium]
MIRTAIFILSCGFLASAPVLAQEQATPTCTAVAAPPAELAGWSRSVSLSSASSSYAARKVRLKAGESAILALHETENMRYAAPLKKQSEANSFGGLARIDVREAGTYRIALGSRAWVDIVSGQTAITSIAHSHGPDCTGIRKMVDFPLTPGRYNVQIADSEQPEIKLLVTRLP